MTENRKKTVVEWGGALPSAPSVQRVDVWGWIWASALLGAVCGWLAMSAAWRPLPGLAAPPGPLAFHAHQALLWLCHWLLPGAFGSEARAYAALLAKLDGAERAALVWRAGLGCWAAFMPAALLARPCLAPRDGLIALRGASRLEGREAVGRLNSLMAARSRARPDHPIAPGVPYPASMWTRHVLVVAGTGSGKSTVLKPLIQSIVEAGESLLLFDPKGEFTKGFGGPEIVGPWDARSVAWDIARDMRNIGDMRRFAGSMVREAQDPMWSNAARQLLVGFMIYLKRGRGVDWGWGELADMVSIPQSRILPIMSEHHPEAVRAVERASVTTQGILINLASFCASIFDLAEAWGDAPPERRVSFVDWATRRGRHRQLILQGHGAYPDLTKSYLEGVLGTVSAIVNSVEMDDDEGRKLWLVADEAAQMGKAPIRALLEVGRSRGVRCVLACQDLAQLEEIHGQHMAKSLVSMVGTILVGQMMPGDTAEQICKALGTREVERQNVSLSQNGAGHFGRSTTLSFSRDELAIYKPSELASRLGPTPNGKGVKLALFTGGDAYELVWPHYTMRSVRPAHVAAAWTMGGAGLAATDLPDGDGEGGVHPPMARDPQLPDIEQRDPERSDVEGADLERQVPKPNESRPFQTMPDVAGNPHASSGQKLREGQDQGASRSREPKVPTAAELALFLRQSVEVRSSGAPMRGGPMVAGEHGARAHRNDLAGHLGMDRQVSRHGGEHRWESLAERSEQASRLAQAGEGLVHPRGELRPTLGRDEETMEGRHGHEVLAELMGESAGHVADGGHGHVLRGAAELLDEFRPRPGPAQVVASVQRPAEEPQWHRPDGASGQGKGKPRERS